MASPHLYLSNNPSMMYIVRPTLVILPKSPQKENKGGDQGEEQEEKMEPQSKCHEVITLPLSSSSSSSSSPSQDFDDSKIREDEVNKKETTTTTTTTTTSSSKEGDEDDGYQTPTSPRHRIPPLLKCPKAPMKKKPSWRRRGMKRGREFWGCFEIGDELGHLKKTKRVRREAAIAN